MKRGIGTAMAVMAALALGSAVSAQEPSPERGGEIAERWCSSCHVVSEAGTGGDVAPSFYRIAEIAIEEDQALRTWLAAPHDPMPDFDLSETDISDILAYIRSLRP